MYFTSLLKKQVLNSLQGHEYQHKKDKNNIQQTNRN